MGPSMQLLFILKWPITEIEKTSKSLKTHSMESIHAKIKSKGMSKLENLPKINIIEEYLLGVPFLRKRTSFIPFWNPLMIFYKVTKPNWAKVVRKINARDCKLTKICL